MLTNHNVVPNDWSPCFKEYMEIYSSDLHAYSLLLWKINHQGHCEHWVWNFPEFNYLVLHAGAISAPEAWLGENWSVCVAPWGTERLLDSLLPLGVRNKSWKFSGAGGRERLEARRQFILSQEGENAWQYSVTKRQPCAYAITASICQGKYFISFLWTPCKLRPRCYIGMGLQYRRWSPARQTQRSIRNRADSQTGKILRLFSSQNNYHNVHIFTLPFQGTWVTIKEFGLDMDRLCVIPGCTMYCVLQGIVAPLRSSRKSCVWLDSFQIQKQCIDYNSCRVLEDDVSGRW